MTALLRLLLIAALTLPFGCSGSGPGTASSFLGATVISGPEQRIARDVATFDDGSVLVGGEFTDEIVLGAGEPNETTLTNPGSWGMLLARYGADGALLWAETAYTSDGNGVSVATLPDDSCLVTGTMRDVVTFGAGQANETTFDTGGDRWTYIARYSPDGALLWAKTAIQVNANDIAAYADGSFVIGGELLDDATFGPGEPGEMVLDPLSDRWDLFVAWYAPDGTFLRASQAGGGVSNTEQSVEAVAAMPDGSCVITGYIRETCVFGSGEPNETTLTTTSSGPGSHWVNPFVARYASDGTLLWAREADSDNHANGFAVAAFADGSSVISGRLTNQPITFGPGEANETVLLGPGLFVARYASTGDLVWARPVESSQGFDQFGGLAALPDGSVLATGSFHQEARAGIGEPNETLLQNDDQTAFLARFEIDGALAWARKGPGPDSSGIAVATAPGGAYVWLGKVYPYEDAMYEGRVLLPASIDDEAIFLLTHRVD